MIYVATVGVGIILEGCKKQPLLMTSCILQPVDVDRKKSTNIVQEKNKNKKYQHNTSWHWSLENYFKRI